MSVLADSVEVSPLDARRVSGVLRVLPVEVRRQLERTGRVREYVAQELVATRGQPCDTVRLVLEGMLVMGRLGANHGAFLRVTHAVAGELYGAHACDDGATHGFDVVAGGAARVLEVSGADFREALALDETGGLTALLCPALRRALLDLFVDDVEPEGVLRLAACFREGTVPEGTVLMPAGATAAEWWVLRQGSVRYGERALGPGEDFALDALLLDAPVFAAATALETSTLLSAPRGATAEVLLRFPGVRRALGRRVARSSAQFNRWPHVVLTDVSAPPEAPPEEEGSMELPERPSSASPWKPVPFYRQQEHMDCGAACLRMVARYYGYELDYPSLMKLAGVSRYGTSLLDLSRTGEQLGFITTGIQADWELLGSVDLPAIAHLQDRHHFVVVWRVTRKGVVVGDPSFSTRFIPREEFLRSWRGVLLLLKPSDRMSTAVAALPPKQKEQSALARFSVLVRPYRWVIAELVGLSLLLQVLALAFPLGSQVVIDRVLMRADAQLLDVLLVGLVVTALLSGVLAFARSYLVLEVSTRIERDVVETLYRRVLDGASGLFQRFTTSDILNRFMEVGLIRGFIVDNAIAITIDVALVLSTAVVLSMYSTTLAVLALALMPLHLLVSAVVGRWVRNHTVAYLSQHDLYQTHLMDSFKGFESLKAHALELPFLRTMQRLLAPSLQHGFKAAMHGAIGASVSQTLDLVGSALVLWVGSRAVLRGELTVGALIAATLFARQMSGPVVRLATQWRDYQRVQAHLERVGAVQDVAGEGDKRASAVLELPQVKGHIRFRGVSFRYGTGRESNTLERLDLEFAPGEVVALVGPSGCGKSTLVRLLLRLHDPGEGTVSIDGYNLRDVTPESVRGQIGMVTQETQLFSGTVFDNIACGRPVTEEAVVRAARLAGAYDFVTELPYGFQTLVGERGLTLSGGQRQRVIIARALVTDPRILIFDEATAALDPLAEQAIHDRLRDIVRGRTTLIISHRLQTLQHADRIVVMNEGRISQMGTHESLMSAQGKLYSALAQATPNWKRHGAEGAHGGD